MTNLKSLKLWPRNLNFKSTLTDFYFQLEFNLASLIQSITMFPHIFLFSHCESQDTQNTNICSHLFYPTTQTDYRGRLSYLSLLFFGTLHSDGYIFPFLLCLYLLFFSQLFVRCPQTIILPFCISFLWGSSQSLPPVQCHEPLSIVLQALYQI